MNLLTGGQNIMYIPLNVGIGLRKHFTNRKLHPSPSTELFPTELSSKLLH